MFTFRQKNANKWLGQPISPKDTVPTSAGQLPSPTTSVRLDLVRLHNRSGGAAPVALIAYIKDASWNAGQWVDATTTYTDDTTDAQDVDTNDFALETLTNSDGHIIGSTVKFGIVGYEITTASVGVGQVHVYEYWNGSAWTAIAAIGMLVDGPRTAGQVWAVGEQIIMFDPPVDWAVGGSGTGVPAANFNLRVRATTAPTTAALARRIYVGQIITSVDQAAANTPQEIRFSWPGLMLDIPPTIGAFGAAFGTADEGNVVEIFYHYGLVS